MSIPVTRIVLTNRNNQNKTEVCTLATREEIECSLESSGWIGAGWIFEKDRVIVTLEQISLFEEVDDALHKLFF